jgi:hypothetical protein
MRFHPFRYGPLVYFLLQFTKRFCMKNQNIPSQGNKQVHPHREGQQQNISSGRNKSVETQNTGGSRQGKSNQSETESQRANRNEDKGIRGGNSSL